MTQNSTQKALLKVVRIELSDQEALMASSKEIKDLDAYMTARARREALQRVVELYDRK